MQKKNKYYNYTWTHTHTHSVLYELDKRIRATLINFTKRLNGQMGMKEKKDSGGTYLEDSDERPQKGIKVLAITNRLAIDRVLLTKLAAKQIHTEDTWSGREEDKGRLERGARGGNCHTYLKIKINNIKSAKKTATLSIVLSIITSCLRRAGMKRTNFNIRNNRKVRNTDRPLLPPPPLPS